MQFLKIFNTTNLSELAKQVGSRVVNRVLTANQLPYDNDVGYHWNQLVDRAKTITGVAVSAARKVGILNKHSEDSEVFEKTAQLTDTQWKVMDQLGAYEDAIRIPDGIQIPKTSNTIGGSNSATSKHIFNTVINDIKFGRQIDPSIFGKQTKVIVPGISGKDFSQFGSGYFDQWFKLPFKDVVLYSSIDDSFVGFPVYPEEYSDSRKANYTTMPDVLYQYEPWQIYTDSGPRSNTYKFDFHRDMWTGDHKDGKANELIRFCQACCYPKYRGSAVHTPFVSLYIHGELLIRGIMTDVHTTMDGPVGHDGFPLHVVLELSITEVSNSPLNYDTVRNKSSIIG